jgi:cell division septation protein DedD
MDAIRQARVAFYLTGSRPVAELEPVEGLHFGPALLARYRDLGSLRHDFPAVLLAGAEAAVGVRPLSGLIDDALKEVAHGEAGERISQHALRFETLLRRAVAGGARGSLRALWTETARQAGADEDEQLRDSLDRIIDAFDVDGELADCDAELPPQLFSHVWQQIQHEKARRLASSVARLVHRVSNILRADFARSTEGRSADSLKASIGGVDAEAIDFDAMSRVLRRTANRTTITEERRRRLEQLASALQSYDFEPQAFRFTSCSQALAAWRERFPMLIDVARAIAMAELEIAGDYREDRHDAFFADYGADGLSPEDISMFADYLVCVNAATMDAQEQAALMEILSSGLPIKILVQTDDILEDALQGSERRGFGRSAPHFANMAVGLTDVYVLQATASHLLSCTGRIADGIAYPGTALFSVFSGATGFSADLPPYMVAAAAVESRAFPVFSYDPSAGADLASRFSVASNPQPEGDWPLHEFSYEDEERRKVSASIAFTFVDFAALDERYARHLARVPHAQWDDAMIPVGEALEAQTEDPPDRVPCLLMVDRQDQLQKVLVDEKLLREARRCREAWHSLQELGGIHNSYAEQVLAEERQARRPGPPQEGEAPPEAVPEAAVPATGEGAAVEAEPEPEPSPDEAYIETPRCTTCNECTEINDKMFAYNDNRQAYIADLDAGTYAQMVEAAESCQVSIIHPGKPRDPDEPGLEELVERAEPFL